MPSITKTVSEMMKGMTAPQWILLVLFLVYFVFPVQFPSPIYQAFESIPGMIFVFCVIVYLFLYSNPVLGIFALLAAYEFFYYSTSSYSPATSKTAFLQYAPQPTTTREIQPTGNPRHHGNPGHSTNPKFNLIDFRGRNGAIHGPNEPARSQYLCRYSIPTSRQFRRRCFHVCLEHYFSEDSFKF